MTNLRRIPKNRFHTFIVEPSPGFEPRNWRQSPKHYRIVKYVGPQVFRGSADAWKFLHNHEALRQGTTNQWALILDIDEVAPIELQNPAATYSVGLNSNSMISFDPQIN